MNFLVAIVAITLFSTPFIGELEVGGASLALLRDFAIGCIAAAYFGQTAARADLRVPCKRAWIILVLSLAAYVAISTLASPYRGWAFNVALRLAAVAMVGLAALSMQVRSDRGYQNAIFGLLSAYSCASIVSWIAVGGGVLEGLLGRHFTKFISLTGLCLALAFIASGNKSWRVRLCGVLAIATGLLCLQRGFLIASAASLLFVLFVSDIEARTRFKIIAAAASVTLLGWELLGDAFMEYAFYENIGPSVILSSLVDGSFDMTMLRTRARLDLGTILVSESKLSFLGHGAGWSKYAIARYYDAGKEPHNDLLVLTYDYGIFGLLLFFLFATTFLYRCKVLSRAPGVGGSYALAAGALFSGCCVWMTFSNVLIYSMGALMFSFLFLGIAEAMRRSTIY